jgi:Protein of unknown function (DUF3142)
VGQPSKLLLVMAFRLLVCFACLFLVNTKLVAQTVNAQDYDSFWLWAGVTPQPVLARAKTVYILQGQVDIPDRGDRAVRMIAQGGAIGKIRNDELWLVYRAHTLRWSPAITEQILSRLKRWQAAGNTVKGVQIDFDSATRHLDEYASFLKEFRTKLPPEQQLGITGLLDWSSEKGTASLNAMSGVVDEVILQTYQGRSTISNYQTYLARTDALKIPFKIGLLQGGEWQAPAGLAGNAYFKGYVVFLKN